MYLQVFTSIIMLKWKQNQAQNDGRHKLLSTNS